MIERKMSLLERLDPKMNTRLQVMLGLQMPAMYHKTRANTAGRLSRMRFGHFPACEQKVFNVNREVISVNKLSAATGEVFGYQADGLLHM